MTFLAYEKPTINIIMKNSILTWKIVQQNYKIIYNRCQINIKDLKA